MTPRQSDGVLWLWSTTELSAAEIGKRMGLTRSVVLGHIYRQRAKEDPRAVTRPRKPKAKKKPALDVRIRELERTLARMRQQQERKAA
jgi:hypothetical protein